MSKRMMVVSFFAFVLAVAGVIFAADYNVNQLRFSGVMTGTGDTDWLTLSGQEGTNPTVCLQHAAGVDFDFAVYNDDNEVCSNIETGTRTCCQGSVPGQCKIRVWSANGSGNYTITIQPGSISSRDDDSRNDQPQGDQNQGEQNQPNDY